MNTQTSTQIHLIKRPVGIPNQDDFAVVKAELASLEADQVLIKNHWMSVDPYMRGRMIERKSYILSFNLNQVMQGAAIGEVIESRHSNYPTGSLVNSMHGWRDYFISDGEGLTKLPATDIPMQAFLGILGMTGMTAYTGLKKIAGLKAGDNVFISAAAGAVGSAACQIAKLSDCYVAGSAGSDDKIRYLLNKLKVDAAINYQTSDDLNQSFISACPQGIDVYYENVGGEHTEAALNAMNDFGRIAVCGLIKQYSATSPVVGPSNFAQILIKRLTVQGFIVFDHWSEYPAFVKQMSEWIESGKIQWEETVYNGLDQSIDALIGLFHGQNLGKMLVKLD